MAFLKLPHQFLVERELKKYAENKFTKKILEIGAGTKSYKRFFKECDFVTTDVKKISGIDESADVTNLQFASDSFDIVLCISVLEHVKDYQKAISEIHRVLKKGGDVIIVTPFLFPLHDVPTDYWRFTGYAFKEILKNFSKVQIKPVILSKFLWRFVLDYFVVAKK